MYVHTSAMFAFLGGGIFNHVRNVHTKSYLNLWMKHSNSTSILSCKNATGQFWDERNPKLLRGSMKQAFN